MIFDDTKADLRETVEWEAVVGVTRSEVDWGAAVHIDYDERDLRSEAPDGAVYVLSDAPIGKSSFFRSATKELKDHLYREQTMTLQVNRPLKLYSRAGETPEAFAQRCEAAADDAKDKEAAVIRDRLTSRMEALNKAIAQYEDRVAELQADVRNRRNQDFISIGSSVLGSILGGRTSTATIARSAGRAATRGQSSAQRISTIVNRIDEKNLAIEDLENDLQEAIADIDAEWSEKASSIEPLEVGLEKTDISVDDMSLLWLAQA